MGNFDYWPAVGNRLTVLLHGPVKKPRNGEETPFDRALADATRDELNRASKRISEMPEKHGYAKERLERIAAQLTMLGTVSSREVKANRPEQNNKRTTIKNGNESIEERFWRNVHKCGPDECWEWQGSTNGEYGIFSYKGKSIAAHRFSYELHHGSIGKGLLVCHECDNPPCCNPKHLFAGTHLDNNRDRVMKGRFMATVTHNGVTKGISVWAMEANLPTQVLYGRLKSGWDMERALTTPVRHFPRITEYGYRETPK